MAKLQVGQEVYVACWPLYDGPHVNKGVLTSIDDDRITYVVRKTTVLHANVDACFPTPEEAASRLVETGRAKIDRLEALIRPFAHA
jgi:hypothetical protein